YFSSTGEADTTSRARAHATAAAGGAGFSGTGADADTTDKPSVITSVDASSQIEGHDVTFTATSLVDADGDATARVGSVVGVGAVDVDLHLDNDALVIIGNGVQLTAHGNVLRLESFADTVADNVDVTGGTGGAAGVGNASATIT